MNFYFFCYEHLKRKKISILKKKKFHSFGKKSIIEKPYLQLSNTKKISIGEDVTILKGCRLSVYGDFNDKSIIIGNRCYIGFNFTALAVSKGKIEIGDDVLIASNVLITNENHGIDPVSNVPYMDQNLTYNNVCIDDGCWIGEKVCILPGVKIGKKSIIGAGSVGTRSIPDYSIAVGNPARVIKKYNFERNCWEAV